MEAIKTAFTGYGQISLPPSLQNESHKAFQNENRNALLISKL